MRATGSGRKSKSARSLSSPTVSESTPTTVCAVLKVYVAPFVPPSVYSSLASRIVDFLGYRFHGRIHCSFFSIEMPASPPWKHRTLAAKVADATSKDNFHPHRVSAVGGRHHGRHCSSVSSNTDTFSSSVASCCGGISHEVESAGTYGQAFLIVDIVIPGKLPRTSRSLL